MNVGLNAWRHWEETLGWEWIELVERTPFWHFRGMLRNSLVERIVDSMRLGGRLIFLQEQAPADLQNILKILSQHAGVFPFVVLSEKQIRTQVMQTQAGDMLAVFASQTNLVDDIAPLLQGQRLADGLEHLSDAQFWADLQKALNAATPLARFSESFSAPCLFLDRDDVVVKNVPYNRDPEQVVLMPGIVELINRAHAASYWVALVTNQSGLGRGWISWSEYQKVHQQMLKLLAAQGAWIDECVWASYYEQAGVGEGRLFANLRKPEGGMFQLVGDKLRVNFTKSVMVGDSATDLVAAYSVKIPNLYLLNSDKIEKEQAVLNEFQKNRSGFSFKTIQNLSEVKL